MLSRQARSCSRRFRQPQVPASTQACGALLQHGRSISSGSFVGSPTANRESSWHRLGIEMKKELSHRAGYATAAQGTPSSDLQSTDLLDVYQSLVARGVLVWDEEQVRCVMELRKLHDELKDYTPPLELLRRLSPDAPILARKLRQNKSKPSWWNKSLFTKKPKGSETEGEMEARRRDEREKALVRVLSGEEELEDLDIPRGILITGPPGTGKSHLLSLFFTLLPTTHKSRQHYHPLLLSLYQSVWRRTQARMKGITAEVREKNMDVAGERGWRAIFAGGAYGHGDEDRAEADVRRVSLSGEEEREGIAFGIARDMILEYHILYFDELQLVDATSAAMLRDIMSWYWRMGGVILATSNRLPEDLYHHGVQKERMNSFLSALTARCTVYELNGGRDWRLGRDEETGEETDGEKALWAGRKRKTWFVGGGEGGEFEMAVGAVTEGEEGKKTSVNVYGRRVKVPWATSKAARFTFSDLCEEALGTADYISLASKYETIIIDQVPYLYLRHKNQARRLINLVDALYESKCKLIVSAESSPEDLFFPDAMDEAARETNEEVMAQEALTEAIAAPFRPNISSYKGSDIGEDQGDAGRVFQKKERAVHPSEETSPAFKTLSIFTGEDERFAYKRAVSRLIEMTRSPAYAHEQWLPVGEAHRRWETVQLSVPPVWKPSTGDPVLPSALQSEGLRVSQRNDTASDDAFAVEAGYSRPQIMGEKPARGAPVIAEDHVWGVREDWGKKAGAWGQGAKAKATKEGDPSTVKKKDE